MKKLNILAMAVALMTLSTISISAQRKTGRSDNRNLKNWGEFRDFNHKGYGAHPYYGIATIPMGYAGFGNNCGYMGYWNQWRCW